jgi:hypothetical protein
MKIEEIAETITVDFSEEGPVFNQDKRYTDPRDVLERCSSFVSESEGNFSWLNLHSRFSTMSTGLIKLSHFSVKVYLLSTVQEYFRIDRKTSNSKISQISIAYLLQFDDDSLPLTMLESMPLAQYAAENWIDHAEWGGMDSTVLRLILHLFTSESAPLKNWIRMCDIDSSGLSMDEAEIFSALYYSSLAGMAEISEYLLLKGENANAEGGELGNPLQAASCGGYKGIQAESCGKYEAIVKLLLENGAEVNAVGGEYGNALQAASYGGSEAIVNLLLENGAEVNAVGGEYGNALEAASYRGSESIVKLLLENGAEVNAVGGEYGNALQAASYEHQENIHFTYT